MPQSRTSRWPSHDSAECRSRGGGATPPIGLTMSCTDNHRCWRYMSIPIVSVMSCHTAQPCQFIRPSVRPTSHPAILNPKSNLNSSPVNQTTTQSKQPLSPNNHSVQTSSQSVSQRAMRPSVRSSVRPSVRPSVVRRGIYPCIHPSSQAIQPGHPARPDQYD